jgi:hypothetical protein
MDCGDVCCKTRTEALETYILVVNSILLENRVCSSSTMDYGDACCLFMS